MKLSGVHLLLTYQCNLECEHCFVWGSPWQSGTMTLRDVRQILQQAVDLGSVQWIYFEGGEPFLYYAVLQRAVQEASSLGFQVGIVSNGYWATDEADAIESLRPFAGYIQDLSISSDIFHWGEKKSQQTEDASAAAEHLGIPVGYLSVAQPETADAAYAVGQLLQGESAVMYRGRAATTLVSRAVHHPWEQFTECPYEDLRELGRVHVDAFGNAQICQGITLGNLFHTPLGELCNAYDPESHPIIGPLLEGGPVELVRRYNVPHEESYADACHLCYQTCRTLRGRFPDVLRPDQMYGVVED